MKLLMGLSAAVAIAAVVAPVGVSAHAMLGSGYDDDMYQTRCDRIANRLSDINATSGDATNYQLRRAQWLIDRSGQLDCSQPATVVDALAQSGNFKTLTAAVNAAGLTDALRAPGPKTVFAPTDAAFAKLPAGTVDALLNDIPTLSKVLENHVVAGEVDANAAIDAGSAPTLAGTTLQVSAHGGFLYVNGVKVILNDIYTGNGVVHVIDAVLVP